MTAASGHTDERTSLARTRCAVGDRENGRAWLWAADDPDAHRKPLARLIDCGTNQVFLDALTTSEAEMAEFALRLERSSRSS